MWLFSDKSGCIQVKLLYLGKVVQSGKIVCIRANVVVFCKVVVFGQKWLYSGKSGSIWAKLVVFGQIDRVRAKWLCSGKSFSSN